MIAKNREVALEEIQRKRGEGENKASGTSKNGYSRGKFSKPKHGESIREINGIWYCHCKFGCRWNKTHTSNFHARWEANKSGFKLPPDHPHSLALIGKYGAGSSGGNGGGSTTGNEKESGSLQKSSSVNFSSITKKCGELEKSSENPQIAQLAGLLRTVFGSLNE